MIYLSKKNVLAIVAGVSSIYVLELVIGVFPLHNLFLPLFAVFIGGLVVGYSTRKKGWMYAGIAGLMLSLLFLVLNFIGYFSPLKELALQTIQKNLAMLPANAIIAMCGGFIGERIFYNRATTK